MDPSRPRPDLALIAVLALVLAACAGGASPAAVESETPAATASPPAPTESATASEAPEESDAATAENVRVRLESSAFDPGELTIATGTEVVFLNADGYAHTVTEGTGGQATDDPIVDREIAENRTVRVTFDEAGTYEITCKFHPSMQMTITVEG